MSSFRVRTTNKLLTAFGASKPSTNVAYDLAYSDFESTLQRLITFDVALKTYATSLKTFHTSASSVFGSIDSLASSGSGTASYQQQSNEVSSMQSYANQAFIACNEVDQIVLQEVSHQLENEVLLPVKGWLQYARQLQQEATKFQEQKALYDHYARKVTGLREIHEKRMTMGKLEKTKETERLVRNEQKLAASTQEYTRLSDIVIRNLRAFVTSRDAALAPLLHRILRGRVVYAERIYEATDRLRILNDHHDEECEDGVLTQFTNVVSNGSLVGSEVILQAMTSSSTVRKVSFDEFVGETKRHKELNVEDNWDAFGSQPFEKEMPNCTFGVSEPTPSNLHEETSVFATLQDISIPSTSVATNPYDIFTQASTNSLFNVNWNPDSISTQECPQYQIPIAEFHDMHQSFR
ncbi:BAR domain [Plasmopara halstedii]|uniref:BAR domain n=1 Tax=Plasmopara halstedii TaxID=4781 RepID=A0A0P1A6R6_PLAHL|nr:BAR domain [Plasmopara halstedii]CEG35925.1 BAR domain [Plasmopara halstedii]|eukprot:XP_024572294.1 BAR domain [Plasmopara halstedii]